MQNREYIQAYVAQRGIFSGHTAEQNLARSVVKLQEEVAEIVATFHPSESQEIQAVTHTFVGAGEAARLALRLNTWDNASLGDISAIRSELADVYVVLACLVGEIERVTGTAFDVAEHALVKARADIIRSTP